MKALSKCLGLLLISATLASCGGGGGSGSHSAFEPTTSGSFTISAVRTQLPLNPNGVLPYPGSPYLSEVTITWRRPNGDLQLGQKISVAIAPVQIAAFSTLDDPTTENQNEFQVLLGSGPVDATNGVATVFVNAGSVTGKATLTVSGRDPDSNQNITKSIDFTVVNATPPLPATVNVNAAPAGVYLASSGGNSASTLTVQVLDASGQTVPNPASGNSAFNNVQVEVVGTAGSGTLTTNDASGQAQTGSVVKTRTLNGIAGAVYRAGTVQGPMQIRVTADAADNNVDNGITTPVVATKTIIVSDGKLYSLTITSPNVNAITENTVSGELSTDATNAPPDPDATYSLTVSALANDRQGNPVLPGTPIRFGLIDEPVGAYNAGAYANRFLHSGTDGDPAEGGNIFTSLSADFIRSNGNGVGPGDALLVFGKSVDGNSDLESAVTIQTVNSDTSLTVTPPFNLNNTTGVSVNNGPVLPYIAGRALHGNITAQAATDDKGVAHVKLNYTIRYLGHIAAIWAQGDGIDPLTNQSKRVTDIDTLLYPGIAPASLTASPSPIFGNTTQQVSVCLTDARLAPITGIRIGFQLTLADGTGSVDGNGLSGTLDNVTGLDGCVIATVVTSGVPATPSSGAGANSGTVKFSVGGATASVDIVVSVGALQVIPASVQVPCLSPPAFNGTIFVLAKDQFGNPLGNQSITATCTAGITINPGTATTNSSGSFTFNYAATNPSGSPLNGSCTFTATGTTRSVTVPFHGVDGSVSPPPTACN